MQLIDSHAHVNFDTYSEDRVEMLERAFGSGVSTIVHPCCTLSEIDSLVALSSEYDGNGKANIYYAVGVHPTETLSWSDESTKIIEDHLNANFVNQSNSKIKAIGETGLDYFHGKSEEELSQQKRAFYDQIAIAKKYKLPLIIHTRDCFDDTLAILKEHYSPGDERSGVLHCYTGGLDFALECIELGFYISWSGILTFKKNDQHREVAKSIPLAKTLIETDSPFLAPQAQRGKRNEPSYVNHVAEVLAECYGISKEELATATTQNTKKLFDI